MEAINSTKHSGYDLCQRRKWLLRRSRKRKSEVFNFICTRMMIYVRSTYAYYRVISDIASQGYIILPSYSMFRVVEEFIAFYTSRLSLWGSVLVIQHLSELLFFHTVVMWIVYLTTCVSDCL